MVQLLSHAIEYPFYQTTIPDTMILCLQIESQFPENLS